MSAVSIGDTQARLPLVDGLRAVAVLGVILFHFFPGAVSGGYIGVDVFFVISGFVIALRYMPRMAAGEVSFRDFYLRRIQRLAPAFLVLIVVVSLVSYGLLKPMELKNYGQSLAAQAGYLQNIVFWLQGDYFDRAATKPLLHTWSLAVEEQFYIFFPILVLALRRNTRWAAGLLIVAFVGSLAVGWLVAHTSPKTAFYLLPTRVWEFAAGIGVAMVYPRIRLGAGPSTALFAVALGLIVFAILGFDEAALFPGPQALAAVAGAALICAVQRNVTASAGVVLSNPVAQHFGRISYSWYLWHWPLVAFYFAAAGRLPGLAEGVAMLVLSYLLAVASYRFVEQAGLGAASLRKPRNGFALLGVMAALVLSAGLYFNFSSGALTRYPPDQRVLYAASMDRVPYRCPWLKRFALYDAEVCRLAPGPGDGVLLLGDSHADRAKGVLSDMARRAGTPFYLTKHNCRPLDYGHGHTCREEVWDQIAADIQRFNIRRVVVIAYWNRADTEAQYREGFERLLATGASVYVQKVAPNAPYFNPIARARGESYPPYTAADYAHDYEVQNRAFGSLEEAYGERLTVLDPVPLLCDGVCNFATGGKPNYTDNNHLGTVGLNRVRPIYDVIFEGLGPRG